MATTSSSTQSKADAAADPSTGRHGAPYHSTTEHRQPSADPRRRRIVVGLDGSVGSRRALQWAAQLAHSRGATLVLLTAADNGPHGDVGQPELKRLLVREVAATAAQHPDLTFEPMMVLDSPSSALVQASHEADLIVIGTRGVGGWHGLPLGSVPPRVAAHSRCPVVVIPEHAPLLSDGPVVVGFDDSATSRAAVAAAFAEAAHRGVPLHVVEVSLPPAPSPASARLRPLVQQYDRVDVVWMREQGRPGLVLARHASSASLLVLGATGSDGSHLLGNTTRKALEHARCPVLVTSGRG